MRCWAKSTKEYEEPALLPSLTRNSRSLLFARFHQFDFCFIWTFEHLENGKESDKFLMVSDRARFLLYSCTAKNKLHWICWTTVFRAGHLNQSWIYKALAKLYRKHLLSFSLSLFRSLSLSPPLSFSFFCLLCLFCGCCRVLQPAAEFMCNTCYTYDMLDVSTVQDKSIAFSLWLQQQKLLPRHNLLITL